MKVKLKICSQCQIPSVIWKNFEGEKYCKSCWSKTTPTKQVVKKQYSIPFRAPERTKEEKLYSAKRIIFLAKHPMCQAHLPECQNKSTEVHHKMGREGDLLLNDCYWLSTCRSCHDFIEKNPEFAKLMGFSLNRL